MSSALISRNPDLQRLLLEGYEVEIRSNHLLVHNVPYVNQRREVAKGTLVSNLSLVGDRTIKPEPHVAYFIGDHPCNIDGKEIVQIKHASQLTNLAPDIVVQHSFSNKPPAGYPDYHEKMIRYIEIVSAPAKALQPAVTACTYRALPARRTTGFSTTWTRLRAALASRQ